jgi:flagellar basal-body rod protein FlgF
MERGLYIAAAGMVAEMVRQDQIANDLANAATPGYKSDRSQQRSFSDLLLQNTKTGETVGTLGEGPLITKQVTDLSPEALRSTGEPTDLAIAGPGYFAVQTSNGVRYTRDGSFKAAANGTLTDQLGNTVLGADRKPVKVNADGTVDVSKVGNFALTGVKKQGDAYFTGTAAGAGKGEVQSGHLEGSGVDAGRTMVDMMASLRAFEAGQKAIQTIDGTLQQAAGQVGSLPA